MAKVKTLLDTNVVVDFLNHRSPFFEKAQLLMMGGYLGEFSLWISSSQMTDLIYILSDGGKATLMPSVLERLQGLRTFVNVYAVGEREIDKMLASPWKDPEDRLLFEVALNIKADCIVTRNKADFESELIRTFDCEEFFAWLKRDFNLDYHLMNLERAAQTPKADAR